MKKAYTFDDVCLVPQYSNVPSRSIPTLESWLTKKRRICIPIVASNMDTVIGSNLAKVLLEYGSIPIFHRFADKEQQITWVNECQGQCYLSCGFQDYEQTFEILRGVTPLGICIDVAHGHCEQMIRLIHTFKEKFPDMDIIAGNVCTAMGYQDLVNAGADAIKVGVGGGCFSKSTRILMANGKYKNINNIRPGEKVINRDGKPVTVLSVKSQGIKDVVCMRSNCWHKNIFVTPEHRYWVGDCSSTLYETIQSRGIPKIIDKLSKTKPKQSKYKWINMEDIDTKRMFVLLPRCIDWELEENFKIDLSNYCLRGEINNSSIITNGNKNGNVTIFNRYIDSCYDTGYVFGLFIGDGCSNVGINKKNCEYGVSSWYLGINEIDIVNKLCKCFKNILGYECSIYYPNEKNIIKVVLYNKSFTKVLAKFGKRTQKHLPKTYYVINKEYIKGLYDGLIDSDGCTEKYGRDHFNNTSWRAIELFNWCCICLGYTFSSRKCKKSIGGLKGVKGKLKQSYRSSHGTLDRFSKDYMYSYILEKNINNDKVEVFDIEVDCPTHSFIANNHIVHNSSCTTRMVTGFGTPQFTAIRECAEMAKKLRVPIIADGGINNARDMALALAAGASSVMMGKLFTKTYESTAPKFRREDDGTYLPWCLNIYVCSDKMYAQYRGQASKCFQEDFYGVVKKGTCPEGVDFYTECSGNASTFLDTFCASLRSSMTYGGAKDIKEFQRKAEFRIVSDTYAHESNYRPE